MSCMNRKWLSDRNLDYTDISITTMNCGDLWEKFIKCGPAVLNNGKIVDDESGPYFKCMKLGGDLTNLAFRLQITHCSLQLEL